MSQVDLDMPEVLWTAYIDFEVGEGELDNARKLYERLLFRSSHVKVWIAYAKFEFASGAGVGGAGEGAEREGEGEGAEAKPLGSIENARAIFSKGYVCTHRAVFLSGVVADKCVLLGADMRHSRARA